MSNPIELLYSWQALVCAAACVGITEAAKTTVDVAIGTKRRKASKVLSQLVLPMTPVWVGALYAAAVPAHPEVLRAYIEAQSIEGVPRLLVLAAWGGACGQFSTYLYERVERLLQTGGARA